MVYWARDWGNIHPIFAENWNYWINVDNTYKHLNNIEPYLKKYWASIKGRCSPNGEY